MSQIVWDTGLTAVDAWAVAGIGQPGARYDPQPVTRSIGVYRLTLAAVFFPKNVAIARNI